MTQSQPSITPKPPLPTLSTTVLRLLSCAFTFHTVFDDREAHGKKDSITLPMSVYEDVWHASYDQGLDFAGNRPHLHRIHNHCRLLDFCVAHIVSVSSLLIIRAGYGPCSGKVCLTNCASGRLRAPARCCDYVFHRDCCADLGIPPAPLFSRPSRRAGSRRRGRYVLMPAVQSWCLVPRTSSKVCRIDSRAMVSVVVLNFLN